MHVTRNIFKGLLRQFEGVPELDQFGGIESKAGEQTGEQTGEQNQFGKCKS